MTHIGVEALGYRIEAGGVLFAYTGDAGPCDEARGAGARRRPVPVRGHVSGARTRLFPFHFERPAGGRARREGRREAADAHPHRARRSTRRSRSPRPPACSTGPSSAADGGTRRWRSARDAARRARERRAPSRGVGARLPGVGRTAPCCSPWARRACLIAASVSEDAPRWLKGTGKGWVTGEYSMLPRVDERTFPARGEQGPSRRAHAGDPAVDRALAPLRDRPREAGRADDHGRLRRLAGRRRHAHRVDHRRLHRARARAARPGRNAASSPTTSWPTAWPPCRVGIVDGEARLDLCYEEDAGADVDFNVVMTGSRRLRRGPGDGRGRAVHARRPGRAARPGGGRASRELTKIQHEALGA